MKKKKAPPKGTGHSLELGTERIIGMEAYKKGLLLWLGANIRKDMRRGASKMSDVYIGRMNAYKDFENHIKGTLRKD